LRPESGKIVEHGEPALQALNEALRDEYVSDSARGVARWNKVIRDAGIDYELKLPHRGFHRAIGLFRDVSVTPDGAIIPREEWERRQDEWLPTTAERQFVGSLMKPVLTPGEFASWIAPPPRGINHRPIEFEYVKLDE